jgi:ABC-type branched-subunit amino acid transport system ATPase component
LIRKVSADRTILMVEHNLSVVADLYSKDLFGAALGNIVMT